MKYWNKPWVIAEGCLHGCEVGDDCWMTGKNSRFKIGEVGKVVFRGDRLEIPLRRKIPTVYHIWCDMFDLNMIDQTTVLLAVSKAEHHKFLALTKHPERFGQVAFDIPNLYIGVSVTDQRTAKERIPALLNSSWKGKKWVNIEPMWGAVNVEPYLRYEGLDQVILGGQTGKNAPPVEVDWVRSVRDQCANAKVPFFLKQIDAQRRRVLDGREHNDLIWRGDMPAIMEFFQPDKPPFECTFAGDVMTWEKGAIRVSGHSLTNEEIEAAHYYQNCRNVPLEGMAGQTRYDGNSRSILLTDSDDKEMVEIYPEDAKVLAKLFTKLAYKVKK